jgi:hypothetical protein
VSLSPLERNANLKTTTLDIEKHLDGDEGVI